MEIRIAHKAAEARNANGTKRREALAMFARVHGGGGWGALIYNARRRCHLPGQAPNQIPEGLRHLYALVFCPGHFGISTSLRSVHAVRARYLAVPMGTVEAHDLDAAECVVTGGSHG